MTEHPRPPEPELPRWLTVLLAASVVVNVLLAGGFVLLLLASVANSDSIRANEIRQCQLANTARQQDVAIWNRLLNVPHPTAAQAKEIGELEHLVKVKDTPRNCSAAFSTGK